MKTNDFQQQQQQEKITIDTSTKDIFSNTISLFHWNYKSNSLNFIETIDSILLISKKNPQSICVLRQKSYIKVCLSIPMEIKPIVFIKWLNNSYWFHSSSYFIYNEDEVKDDDEMTPNISNDDDDDNDNENIKKEEKLKISFGIKEIMEVLSLYQNDQAKKYSDKDSIVVHYQQYGTFMYDSKKRQTHQILSLSFNTQQNALYLLNKFRQGKSSIKIEGGYYEICLLDHKINKNDKKPSKIQTDNHVVYISQQVSSLYNMCNNNGRSKTNIHISKKEYEEASVNSLITNLHILIHPFNVIYDNNVTSRKYRLYTNNKEIVCNKNMDIHFSKQWVLLGRNILHPIDNNRWTPMEIVGPFSMDYYSTICILYNDKDITKPKKIVTINNNDEQTTTELPPKEKVIIDNVLTRFLKKKEEIEEMNKKRKYNENIMKDKPEHVDNVLPSMEDKHVNKKRKLVQTSLSFKI